MKNFTSLNKYLFCVLICIGTLSNAQTVSTDYANTVNSIFAGVDLNRVPHHLLTDYAMEFVDLKGYNGVVTDSNYVQKGTYTAIYNTLLMSRTSIDVTSLVHPDMYESNLQDARDDYTISLSGLYYKYSRLRESANPQNITVSNNKYYDKYVNGVWQDPYEQDQVFAANT